MKSVLIKVTLILIFYGMSINAAPLSVGDFQKNEPGKIFEDFRDGIVNNNISAFTGYFHGDVLIKLRNGVSDYFTPNQAFFVLKDFFDEYNIVSFGYKNISAEGNFPSASGVLDYRHNGMSGSALVFISLEKKNGEWVIVQITIN